MTRKEAAWILWIALGAQIVLAELIIRRNLIPIALIALGVWSMITALAIFSESRDHCFDGMG
jgi:lipid-A-disaccharide synthase-like uncharacterized protein